MRTTSEPHHYFSPIRALHLTSSSSMVRWGLKGTHYKDNTFPGIWGVFWVSGSYTHTAFEKSLYMIFSVRYAFLKVPPPTVNERVSFGAPSYVGRRHSWIWPPTSLLPSNQSIAKILWTSGRETFRPPPKRTASASAVRQLWCGELGSSPAAQLPEYGRDIIYNIT